MRISIDKWLYRSIENLTGYGGGKEKSKTIAAHSLAMYYKHRGLQFISAAVIAFNILFLAWNRNRCLHWPLCIFSHKVFASFWNTVDILRIYFCFWDGAVVQSIQIKSPLRISLSSFPVLPIMLEKYLIKNLTLTNCVKYFFPLLPFSVWV